MSYVKDMGYLILGGAIGRPDYSTPLGSGSNGSYVATEDCWFNIYASSGYGRSQVTVNSVTLGSVSRAFEEESPSAYMLSQLKREIL